MRSLVPSASEAVRLDSVRRLSHPATQPCHGKELNTNRLLQER